MAGRKPRTAKEVIEARMARIAEQLKEKKEVIAALEDELRRAEAALAAMIR